MEICTYCGEPRGEQLSCCGENHWEEVEECPDCAGNGTQSDSLVSCETCDGTGYIYVAMKDGG